MKKTTWTRSFLATNVIPPELAYLIAVATGISSENAAFMRLAVTRTKPTPDGYRIEILVRKLRPE